MRLRWSIISLVLLLTVSCTRKGIRRADAPKDLIPPDSMVILLKELAKLESAAQVKYVQPLRYKKDLQLSADSLFRHWKLDSSRFSRSMDYYAEYQERMKTIYSVVLDSINVEIEREKQATKK